MEQGSAYESGSIVEQLRRYDSEIERLRGAIDQILGHGATTSRVPGDLVVFSLLVSCRDIVEEILFAVKDGFGRTALRSVRTLYECVVFARFLHLHPDKQESFVNTFYAQWAKTIQNIPPEYRPPDIHNAVSSKIFKYASGKTVGTNDLKWTSEHTLQMANEVGLSVLHSVAFDYTSAYIHPSAIFLLSNLSLSESAEHVVRVSANSQEPDSRFALLLAHELILNALDFRLKCSPSDQHKASLDQCKRDYEHIWGHAPVSL
jgi:hypothetical protein